MKLHQIESPAGAIQKRKRVGRGDASGCGGTSTRGHKGHKSRKGYSLSYNFEGGQIPLVRRLPKRGFTHIKKECKELVSLERIEKSLTANDIVTPEILIKSGLVKKGENIKILGEGTVNRKIEVHAHAFSAKAKEKIEKSGGKAVIIAVR
jgi:large subunit ribosomal protein L15